MSGGKFGYASDIFWGVAHEIEEVIAMNDTTPGYGQKYYQEVFGPLDYPEDIVDEFRKAVVIMKLAAVYERRIDWLLSGDDGENSFRKRLVDDLAAEGLLEAAAAIVPDNVKRETPNG